MGLFLVRTSHSSHSLPQGQGSPHPLRPVPPGLGVSLQVLSSWCSPRPLPFDPSSDTPSLFQAPTLYASLSPTLRGPVACHEQEMPHLPSGH